MVLLDSEWFGQANVQPRRQVTDLGGVVVAVAVCVFPFGRLLPQLLFLLKKKPLGCKRHCHMVYHHNMTTVD